MVECTTTGYLRDRLLVPRRLRQTGMSSHYGPWHYHDSAPHLGPKKKAVSSCLHQMLIFHTSAPQDF